VAQVENTEAAEVEVVQQINQRPQTVVLVV
jgi:hypothetical protein